jgi:digeranylgeranylglycerophospholipid reductase
MKAISCEILVIGAGPAGATAARAAAEAGCHVLMVERRTRVGMPVQCAEYIPAMLLGQLEVKRDFIAQKTEGMRTFLPGQEVHETRAPGYVIHRDRFDQALADGAVHAGAELHTGTRALSIDREGRVTLKTKKQVVFKVQPRVIIGADGPRSTVGGWVNQINHHLLPGVQVTLPLSQPLTHTEIYFDPRIVGGYAWLFPKGDIANVGLGLTAALSPPRAARRLLDNFVARLVADRKVAAKPLAHAAGWIPAVPVRSAVCGNILLAGDAAGHTHPITGAGIFTAVSAGRMAGRWAARAIRDDDLTLLQKYDEEWQDLLGDTLQRAAERRHLMENNWADFDKIIKTCWVAYREYYAHAK